MHKLPTWLFHSFFSFLLWGFWGFFGKLASFSMRGEALLLFSSIGWLTTFPLYYFLYRNIFHSTTLGIDVLWAILSGIAGSLGVLFFYFALARGEATRVVAITAAYPLVTALLALFLLREPFTLSKSLGLIFAILGIYFLSR
ncbi:MAG: EamA family transporter [Anaerolineales bacterium]